MSENIKYKFLQSSYWMVYCVCFGYSTVYFQGNGYSASQIGLLTALFCMLAAFLSPALGKIADRSERLNWKIQMQCIILINILLCLSICLIPGKLFRGIAFGFVIMLESSMMPLLNSASFYYTNKGKRVDFGSARGLGSLSFAVLSLILGAVTEKSGISIVPVFGILSLIIMLGVTFMLPYEKCNSNEGNRDEASKAKVKKNNVSEKVINKIFFLRYPAFSLMLIACICMMITHNIENTYLIRIVEAAGGSNDTLGVALAVAACLELPVMFGYAFIVKRISSVKLLFVAEVAFIIKTYLYFISSNLVILFMAQTMQIFSYAIFASASVYYAEEAMDEKDKVSGQAYMSTTIVLGTVFGNLIGGWAIDQFGLKSMLLIALGIVAFGAIVAAAANIKEKRNKNELSVS